MNSDNKIFDANSDKQLLKNTLYILAIGISIGLFLMEFRFALGLLIGGALTLLNYFWLKRSLTKMFEMIVSTGQKPFFPVTNYVLRYLAFGVLIYFIYKTDIASVTAVLIGLCSLATAVFLEGIFLTFRTFVKEVK